VTGIGGAFEQQSGAMGKQMKRAEAREKSDPEIQRSFKGHRGAVTGLAFNPNMRQLATSSTDKSVMLWNFKPQLRAFRFAGHSDAVLSVAFSSATSFVASGSKDRTARLWIPTVSALATTFCLRLLQHTFVALHASFHLPTSAAKASRASLKAIQRASAPSTFHPTAASSSPAAMTKP
jgi:WD40 repeat protein